MRARQSGPCRRTLTPARALALLRPPPSSSPWGPVSPGAASRCDLVGVLAQLICSSAKRGRRKCVLRWGCGRGRSLCQGMRPQPPALPQACERDRTRAVRLWRSPDGAHVAYRVILSIRCRAVIRCPVRLERTLRGYTPFSVTYGCPRAHTRWTRPGRTCSYFG